MRWVRSFDIIKDAEANHEVYGNLLFSTEDLIVVFVRYLPALVDTGFEIFSMFHSSYILPDFLCYHLPEPVNCTSNGRR